MWVWGYLHLVINQSFLYSLVSHFSGIYPFLANAFIACYNYMLTIDLIDDDDDDDDLFGPFIITFVIFKERPTTTNSA